MREDETMAREIRSRTGKNGIQLIQALIERGVSEFRAVSIVEKLTREGIE